MAGRGNSERCDDSMCFFFSSRRRHTRFDCDWSSDVCSSDLCKYVSNKVIVAKMFCTQPVCVVFDAQAKQDHGSHVSGIAAGVANTCAPFVGCTMSGGAPQAFLGSYNVFPGKVTDASSADIAMAVDAAVADGMDVLNLSLGGAPTSHDPLVTAVDDAVDAGVIVAIAAGNAGPGPATIEIGRASCRERV